MAHCGLIGDSRAFATIEKPDAIVCPTSVQDACFAMACVAHEHQVPPAEMCGPPMAANNLLQGAQRFAASRPERKSQHQLPCIRSTGHLKPNGSEEQPTNAKLELPLAGQFMHVNACALHVAKLAL
jgi:hypothetical protein